MWTWMRSSSFSFFRDWALKPSLEFFIFLADRLSGRTWYGPAWCLISHVFSHGRYTIRSPPSPVALLFMALSVTNYVFSGVDLFSSATKQWALFIYFFCFFLHSYLLYFYCVKRYDRVRWPSHNIPISFSWIARVFWLAGRCWFGVVYKLLIGFLLSIGQ